MRTRHEPPKRGVHATLPSSKQYDLDDISEKKTISFCNKIQKLDIIDMNTTSLERAVSHSDVIGTELVREKELQEETYLKRDEQNRPIRRKVYGKTTNTIEDFQNISALVAQGSDLRFFLRCPQGESKYQKLQKLRTVDLQNVSVTVKGLIELLEAAPNITQLTATNIKLVGQTTPQQLAKLEQLLINRATASNTFAAASLLKCIREKKSTLPEGTSIREKFARGKLEVDQRAADIEAGFNTEMAASRTASRDSAQPVVIDRKTRDRELLSSRSTRRNVMSQGNQEDMIVSKVYHVPEKPNTRQGSLPPPAVRFDEEDGSTSEEDFSDEPYPSYKQPAADVTSTYRSQVQLQRFPDNHYIMELKRAATMYNIRVEPGKKCKVEIQRQSAELVDNQNNVLLSTSAQATTVKSPFLKDKNISLATKASMVLRSLGYPTDGGRSAPDLKYPEHLNFDAKNEKWGALKEEIEAQYQDLRNDHLYASSMRYD